MPPVVFRNDEIDIQAIKDLIARRKIENVIISPGPGTPGRQKDVGEQETQHSPVAVSKPANIKLLTRS